jgi:KDO2-lipid IV(A) lauroyltransferase
MRKHLLDRPASYYAIYLCTRYLPIGLCRLLARSVTGIVYLFSWEDRRNFAANLSLALNRPAEDASIKRITRRMIFNYGQYMIDFFLMPQLPPDRLRAFFSEFLNEDVLARALAAGKGAILISPHLGNWEFGSLVLRARDYPLGVVALPHNTPLTNALVNRMRSDKGVRVFEMGESPLSAIEIIRYLRGNGIVAMVGDRDFLGRGRPVRYFGKEVLFPAGPVVLAMTSGAALIPAFVLRRNDGRYFGVLEDPIPLVTDGGRNEAISENLHRTARVFEAYVRRYPDQWYAPRPIDEGAPR